jgi:hypothetical protein
MDDRARWVRLLADSNSDVLSQPRRICELCVEKLGVTGAGISVVTSSGNRGVVCSTDDVAAQIEDLQFTLGEGPCMDAVASGSPVLIPDLSERGAIATERWPAFLEAADGAGVRAVFAFPLLIGAITVGAIDLYRDAPGDLSDTQLPAALLAADAAALSLLHSTRGSEAGGEAGGGTAYAQQVHQATGMVQVQLGVTTEEALLSLRARAFATGQPLLELANDVVHRRVRFSMEDQ